ncbi:hypothetical protein OG588_49000 [Streptomyces prunicolor]|uniref:hypothetical protein n=1 Tax=Streptomyces prunicolor TaxID=67348 RepID=UPI0038651AE4|nr:hypothetical protein OG588_49000 [Streptomyces prunicolor]
MPHRTSTNLWATAVPTADASGHEQIGGAEQGADTHRVKVTFRKFGNTARVARNSVSQDIARLCTRPGAAFSDVAQLASGKHGRQRVPGEGDVEGGMWWAGRVESCETVVPTIVAIVADAEDIVRDRLRRQLAPPGPELV